MTIIELSAKHDIPHEKAVAFLRDWLDGQTVVGYTYIGWIDAVKKGSIGNFFADDNFGNMDITLIARPELGDL